MALTNPQRRTEEKRGRKKRRGKGENKGWSAGVVWKASLKINVFNCFLKINRERAKRRSSGS